jgi:LmbE family N-acetylglucosaminyl deacetylase
METLLTPYQCHTALPARRLLVLAPHPDDEVFGCGGTLCNMAAAGAEVSVWIVTEGVVRHQWGHLPEPERSRVREQLVATRQAESRRAASLLGCPEPRFLTYEDGWLWEEAELPQQLLGLLDEQLPDMILAPSPWEMHRDHRALAAAALQLLAALPDSTRLAFYEVGVPLPCNYLVDITPVAGHKWAAMQAFTSQLQQQAYAEQLAGLNRFRSYTLGPDVQQAEAFYLLAPAEIDTFVESMLAGVAPERLTLALRQAEQRLQAASAAQNEREVAPPASRWRQLLSRLLS